MAKSIKEKCSEIGISLPTYYLRLKKGMTSEEALSTPNKRRQPKTEPAPLPISEPEDQEPRAPVMFRFCGTPSCVFENDFQNRQREFNKNRTKRLAKTASAAPLERHIAESGDHNRQTPNKEPKAPAPVASPVYDRETEKVDNFEYVNRKPLYYGPIRNGVQRKDPEASKSDVDGKFNHSCGGYTAVVLNHAKEGEFKYQIYSTNSGNKMYTNDVVRFINGIIKICDPEGKTPFRVIER